MAVDLTTTIELFNKNRIQTVVYAADHESVIIQPLSKVTVNQKYKWQIPKGVRIVRDVAPSSNLDQTSN